MLLLDHVKNQDKCCGRTKMIAILSRILPENNELRYLDIKNITESHLLQIGRITNVGQHTVNWLRKTLGIELQPKLQKIKVEINTLDNKILEVLNFYANQLLDYNEVVSQELLADKGQRARDLIALLAADSSDISE